MHKYSMAAIFLVLFISSYVTGQYNLRGGATVTEERFWKVWNGLAELNRHQRIAPAIGGTFGWLWNICILCDRIKQDCELEQFDSIKNYLKTGIITKTDLKRIEFLGITKQGVLDQETRNIITAIIPATLMKKYFEIELPIIIPK